MVLTAALLSDIYDGVLARRWSCDTARLRLADSLTDTVFYLGVLAALMVRRPDVLRQDAGLLAALLVLEVLRYIVDIRKFGKVASYHSYLAKVWGLVMAVAVMTVFVTSSGRWVLALSLVLGIASDVEGLIFSAVLPEWRHDVKTLKQAIALRRGLRGVPGRI